MTAIEWVGLRARFPQPGRPGGSCGPATSPAGQVHDRVGVDEMDLIETLRRDRPVVVAECRHCGTSVDTDTTTCPVCEAEAIAIYNIR